MNVIANSLKDARPSSVSVKQCFQQRQVNPFIRNQDECQQYTMSRSQGNRPCVNCRKHYPYRIIFDFPCCYVCKEGFVRSLLLVGDRWPIPKIGGVLDDMKGSDVFTTMDLFQGYWKIKMIEACKEKASFMCRYGTFQYEVSHSD